MDNNLFKKTLEKILQDEKSWHTLDQSQILSYMMNEIGSPDSELRDKLIYRVFCQLILNNHLSEEMLISLLQESLSDHKLLYGLGGNGDDSVFTRSFSSLLIALILYMDRKHLFLPSALLNHVQDTLIQYLEGEKDVRGYVENKGWAHSIAHAADAFNEMVLHPSCNRTRYPEMAKSLFHAFFIQHSLFQHDEELRIALPLVNMLERGLQPDVLLMLTSSIPEQLKHKEPVLPPNQYWHLHGNGKSLLYTLHFNCSRNQDKHNCLQSLSKSLEAFIG
ncbi:DUF2785 domain-containing protein [Bacillus testis]|uniref:DUF2785 domain-containing protein n=1 Tax=Bacillus testis TaxID=1622072 RepID=UPI00067EE55C|nr:DUF2785 domain-containing protein [Bacillus testis]